MKLVISGVPQTGVPIINHIPINAYGAGHRNEKIWTDPLNTALGVAVVGNYQTRGGYGRFLLHILSGVDAQKTLDEFVRDIALAMRSGFELEQKASVVVCPHPPYAEDKKLAEEQEHRNDELIRRLRVALGFDLPAVYHDYGEGKNIVIGADNRVVVEDRE